MASQRFVSLVHHADRVLHFLFYLLAIVGFVLTMESIRRRRAGTADGFFRGMSPQAWTFAFLAMTVIGFTGLFAGK